MSNWIHFFGKMIELAQFHVTMLRGPRSGVCEEDPQAC